MIGILLFLLLFYLLCNTVFSQESNEVQQELNDVQVDMLVDFSGISNMLLQVFARFLADYYIILIGVFVAYLFLGYIQGVLEGKKERLLRKQAVQKEINKAEDKRERAERRRLDKFLERESELIRKYTHASDERIAGIQWEMRAEQEVKDNEQELRLSPYDQWDTSVRRSDVFRFSGKVAFQEYDVGLYSDRESYTYGGRGTTYFREDGTEESGGLYASKAVIDRNSNRNRFHRGMEDVDEGGGY
jgi:hypothetical protein